MGTLRIGLKNEIGKLSDPQMQHISLKMAAPLSQTLPAGKLILILISTM